MEVDAAIQDERAVNLISTQVQANKMSTLTSNMDVVATSGPPLLSMLEPRNHMKLL